MAKQPIRSGCLPWVWPAPWRVDPRLAAALRPVGEAIGGELDARLRPHVHALIQVAHVLLHVCTHLATHLNAAWVSWRCVLVCMELAVVDVRPARQRP